MADPGLNRRLRIIAGRWRGRKLSVVDAPGLRPTPDRVRETLFNWLGPWIEGRRCLDLYAGSGALGLEALSRGADLVVAVDREPRVCRQLREHAALLGTHGLEVVQADARHYCAVAARQPFDLVFLDPPFGQGLLAPVFQQLQERGCLAAGTRVYLESEATLEAPALPAGWTLHRSGRAGQVRYHLAIATAPAL